MKVKIHHRTGHKQVLDRVIDRTGLSGGYYGPNAVYHERIVWRPYSYVQAEVDGTLLTEDQTSQALRDARLCRCNGNQCLCC